MKILCKNKHWNIPENYDINKILYLLIDRPDYITDNRNISWINKKGQLHRNYDLPSYMCYNGYISWHTNNVWHRGNSKPSVIWSNGYCEYWVNGNFIKVYTNENIM